jgi:hypothetical protein
MAKKAAMVPGNYFYIFPEKEQARRAVWEKIVNEETGQKLMQMLPDDDMIPGLGLVTRINNQEMVIELYNNSTIRLIGLDKDPDKARGISPTGIIFSEFAFSDPQAYANVTPALRREGSWCIVNSTPNGRNHFYEMMLHCKQDPDWYVSHLQGTDPQADNYVKIHTKEEYDAMISMGTHTQDDIDREYGCSFATSMKGAIYADLIDVAWSKDRIGTYVPDEHSPVHTFWDLGLDDSTAIWFMQKIGNAYVFIDYFEKNGEGIDFYVDKLKELGYTYGIHYLPHDADHRVNGRVVSTVAQSFEESCYEKEVSGDYEVLPKLGIQDGIEQTRQKFSRCFFDSRACSEGLKRLELYHRKYDKRRKIFIKDPVHDENSHAADAFRMFGIHENKRTDMFYQINKLTINTDYDLFD